MVEVGDGRVGDQAAVAQDDHAIGQVEHLVEAVRDEDHASAARGGGPHRGEQAADLVAVSAAVGSSRISRPRGSSQPSSARAIATIARSAGVSWATGAVTSNVTPNRAQELLARARPPGGAWREAPQPRRGAGRDRGSRPC